MDFSTIKTTSRKVWGKNADFSTIEITLNKVRGNDAHFLIIKITSKKVRRNDVDFLISQITLKKFGEMTSKFVEILTLMYRRNIDMEFTSIWRGAPVELLVPSYGGRGWSFANFSKLWKTGKTNENSLKAISS